MLLFLAIPVLQTVISYNLIPWPLARTILFLGLGEELIAVLFPPFHAVEAVIRAAENHLAFGLGTVNGLSMLIDPYGRITAEGKVNQRAVIVGETFVVQAEAIYTRFGDWFGWSMLAGLLALIVFSIQKI